MTERRGSVSRRRQGWQYRLDVAPPGMPRRQETRSGFATRREAQAALNKRLHELGQGAVGTSERLTVGELLDRWLKDDVTPRLSLSSVQAYTCFCEKHLKPALGKIRLTALTPLHIQGYYAEALRSGRKAGGALSAASVRQHHRVLRAALQAAVRWGLLGFNPADRVTLPAVERPQRPAPDLRLVRAWREAAAGTWLEIPLLLALHTGLRRSEILGLRWEDIDFKTGSLTVRQAALPQPGGGARLSRPKTPRARRLLSIPETVVEALTRQRSTTDRLRREAGPLWTEHDLVFPREDGQPQNPQCLSHAFDALVKRCGGGPWTFHDLRHLHATLALRSGSDLNTVADRMGHHSAAFTLGTYGHVLAGADEELSRRVEAALEED